MSAHAATVFCRTGENHWRRVASHDDSGVVADEQAVPFEKAWSARVTNEMPARTVRFPFNQLQVPLPEFDRPALAYALTYADHQQEARLENVFSFEKRGAPTPAWASISYRPALDYEAEVALLLHREEPGKFGYLLANDLTDRAHQVLTHSRSNPAPGFSTAKSFPGALRIGPLLVIGDAELWPMLEVRLQVNGEVRQQLSAVDCLLSPELFHRQAFSDAKVPWRLVLTGTTSGTIFRSPSPLQRAALLLRAGFSLSRARERWLRKFRFLQVNDGLAITSEILGTSYATVQPDIG